jgi:hypothetical protein
MGYLIEFALGIGGNLIAAEIIFHHKRWSQRIIRSAAERIRDPGQSEIKLEEWLAALDDHVGMFASFSHALGCWIGAPAVAAALKQPIPNAAVDHRSKLVARTDIGFRFRGLAPFKLRWRFFVAEIKETWLLADDMSDKAAEALQQRPRLLVSALVTSFVSFLASIIWLWVKLL